MAPMTQLAVMLDIGSKHGIEVLPVIPYFCHYSIYYVRQGSRLHVEKKEEGKHKNSS